MMKRFLGLAFLMLTCATAPALADDYTYPYMAYVNSSGDIEYLSVTDMVMTISDGQLVVVNASTNETFTLTDLTKMYFTDATGISAVNTDATDSQDVAVFTASGVKMGSYCKLSDLQNALPKGVYIVKKNGKTQKIAVK